MRRIRTRAVHAGREEFEELGVHAPPLDLSSTYPLRDPERAAASLGRMAQGGTPLDGEAIYSRLHNPTVARFERALAELEGGEEGVAFASGMAALSAVLMAARERGREVVALRPLYGGSDHLIDSGLLGLSVKWVRPDEVVGAVGPETALVVLETPANPTLDLVDLREVVDAAGTVPVLVDNTFATPVLQRPHDFGVRLVLHSATKFLGGHGDVLGGAVTCDAEWARALRRIRVATGGVLHPLAGYLLHRGLSTLPLRVEAAQSNAIDLARRLTGHPYVTGVRHPSLPGQDPRGLVGRQMRGPGSILAFEVEGGRAVALRVLRELRCATPAVSLGSVDTLVQHPASLTHQVVETTAREDSGVSESTLRVSVGVEDVEDLWEDLDGAIRRAHAHVLHAST